MENLNELKLNISNPFEPVEPTQKPFRSLSSLSQIVPTPEQTLENPYNITPLNKIEGIGRYLHSESFPELGYSMNDPNIENKYYDASSAFTQGKNAFVQLFGQAGTAWDAQFAKLEQVKETFGSPTEGYLPDQFDASEALRDAYPVFKSNKEVSGILGYVPFREGSASKWSNFAPNLGFTLGTAAGVLVENLVATAIIEGTTGGAGTGLAAAKWVKSGYDAVKNIRNFYNLSKIGKGVMDLTKVFGSAGNIIRGAEALKSGKSLMGSMHMLYGGYQLYSNTAGEALVENANSVGELVRDLKNEFVDRNGREPNGEELAKMQEAAEGLVLPSSLSNIGILMASNFLQQTNAFKAGKSLSTLAISGSNLLAKEVERKVVIDQLTGLAKEATKLGVAKQITKFAGSTGLSIISEGFEESAQGVVAKATQDYFKAKYYDKPISWTDSLGTGFAYASSDQGMEEFAAGVLTGALFTTGGLAKNRYQLSRDVNKLKKETGKTVEDLAKEQITDINENIIPLLKFNMASSKAMENLKYQAALSERIKEANEQGDDYSADKYKIAGLASAMFTAKTYGKDKLLLDYYKELSGLEKSEVAKYFEVEEDELDSKENFEKNISRLEDISKLVDQAAENYKNPFKKTTLADAKYAKMSAEEAKEEYIKDNSLYDAWQAQQELLVQQSFIATEIKKNMAEVTADLRKTNVSFDLLATLVTQTEMDQKENAKFDEENAEYLKKNKELTLLQEKYQDLNEQSKEVNRMLSRLKSENEMIEDETGVVRVNTATKVDNFYQRELISYLERKSELENEKQEVLKSMEDLGLDLGNDTEKLNIINLGRKLYEIEKKKAEKREETGPKYKRKEQLAFASLNYINSIRNKMSDLRELRNSYDMKTPEGRKFAQEKNNEIEQLQMELMIIMNPKLNVKEKLEQINNIRDEKDKLIFDTSIIEGENGVNSIEGILKTFDLLGRMKEDIDYSEDVIGTLNNIKKMSDRSDSTFERVWKARQKLFKNITEDNTDNGETPVLEVKAPEVITEQKTPINNPPEKKKNLEVGDVVYYEGKEYKILSVKITEDGVRFTIQNDEEILDNVKKSKLSTEPVEEAPLSELEKRNKDLFPDETDFGKFEKPVRIKEYFEVKGIGFATYENKDTGVIEVAIAALSDNDYMAYMRNKDSNDFTAKFDSTEASASNVKTMVSELQKLLPDGHRIMEDLSVSTDAIKFTTKQLEFGYEVAKDEDGNVLTTTVGVNAASKKNILGIPVNKSGEGRFDNINVNNYDDFLKVQTALLPLLEKLGLTSDDIKWVSNNGVEASGRKNIEKLSKDHNGGTVQINFPIIKQVSKEEKLNEIEELVITDENYNNWSNVRDKSDYEAFVNQVRSTLAMFDRVPDKSTITAENVETSLASVKAFSNKAIRDMVIPLIVNKYAEKAIEENEEPISEIETKKDDTERRRQEKYNTQYNALVDGQVLDNEGDPVYEEDKGIGSNGLSTLTDKKYGHGHIRTSGLDSLKVLESLLDGSDFSGMFGQIGVGEYSTWESGKFIIVSNNINPTTNNKLNLNEIEVILNAGLSPFAQELANKYPNVTFKDFNGKKYNAELAALEGTAETTEEKEPEVKEIYGTPQSYEGTKEENLDRLDEEEAAELEEQEKILKELEELYNEFDKPTVTKTQPEEKESTEDITEGDFVEQTEKKLEDPGNKLVNVVIETEVNETEIEDLQEELGTENAEETKEELAKAVKRDLQENGTRIERNPKSVLKRIVARLKKVILGLILSGSILGTTYIANTYNIDQIQSFGTRQLAKWGLITPQEETLKIKKDTSVIDYNLGDSAYEAQITKFEKLGQSKGIWSYRNQWLNKNGFVYIPGVNNANFRENNEIVHKGVEGVAHFLIMKNGANDLTSLTSDADLKVASAKVMSEVKETDYVPVIKRNEDGNVHLHFELGKNIKKDDLTPIKLRQTLVSDLDFENTKKADGFKNAKSPTLRSTGKNFNSLLYTGSQSSYGTFSGGAVVLIFKDTVGNTIVREYSGSIEGIRNEIQTVKEQFKLNDDQITLGVFDAGSYTGKVGAIDGSVNPQRYQGYNPEGTAGASLLIPTQDNNTLEASLGILSLLSFFRRKKQNNEPVTPDELTDLREAIIEVKKKIQDIKNKYIEKRREVEAYFSKGQKESLGSEAESIEEVVFQDEKTESFADQLNRIVNKIIELSDKELPIEGSLNTEDTDFYNKNKELINKMVLDHYKNKEEEESQVEELNAKKEEKIVDGITGFINAFNKFFSFGEIVNPNSPSAVYQVLSKIKYSIAPSWFEFKTKAASIELRDSFKTQADSTEYSAEVTYKNPKLKEPGRYNHVIINKEEEPYYNTFTLFPNQYSMHLDITDKNANDISKILFDFAKNNKVYFLIESSYNLARPDNVRIYSREDNELTAEQLKGLETEFAKFVENDIDNPLIGSIVYNKMPTATSLRNTIKLMDEDIQDMVLNYLGMFKDDREFLTTLKPYKNGLSLESLKTAVLFSKIYKEYKKSGTITDESIITPIIEMQIKKTKLYGEIKQINDSLHSSSFDNVRDQDFFNDLLKKVSKRMKGFSTFNFGLYNLSIGQTIYNSETGTPSKIIDHTLLSKNNNLTLSITIQEGTKEIYLTPFEFKSKYSTEPIIPKNDFESLKEIEIEEISNKDDNKLPNTLTTTISNDDDTFYGKDTVDQNIAIGKLAIQKLEENIDEDYFVTVQSPDFDNEESPFFISSTGDYNPNVPTEIQDLYREGNLKNFEGLSQEEKDSLLAQGIKGFGKIVVLTDKNGEYSLFDKQGNKSKKGIIPMFFLPTGSLKILDDTISYGWTMGEQFRGRILQPISVMARKLSTEEKQVTKEDIIKDKEKQAKILDDLQTNPDTVIFKVSGFSKGVTDAKDTLTFTDLKQFQGPNMKLMYPMIDVTTEESGTLTLMVNNTSIPLQKKAIGKEVALGILAYLGMDPMYISSVHGFKVGKEITDKVEKLKQQINRTNSKERRHELYRAHINQLSKTLYQGKNGIHVIYENIFAEDSIETQDLFEAIQFPDYGRDENGKVIRMDSKTFMINNTLKKLRPGMSISDYYQQLNQVVDFLSKVSFDAGKSFVENKKDTNFVTEGDTITIKEVNTMEYLLGTKNEEGEIITPSRYEARGIVINNSILTGKNKYIILGDPIVGPVSKKEAPKKKSKKPASIFAGMSDVEFKSEYEEDLEEIAKKLEDKKLQAIADVKPLLEDKEERKAIVKRIKEAKDLETINKIIKEVNCR